MSEKVNILTNDGCPNSRAFNFPFLAARDILREKGMDITFFGGADSKRLFDCGCLFINSNVFRSFWRERKEEIFAFLSRAQEQKIRIFWFDTTDSTWCTQFEVMPYVERLMKSQIFRNKDMYLQRFATGRIFTDYFEALYSCGEERAEYPLPEVKDLHKLAVSWNTCFENYTESRFSLISKLGRRLRPLLWNLRGEKINVAFTPPEKERPVKISCRAGISHSRVSVAAHRNAIMELLDGRAVPRGKIPLAQYFAEMRDAQIALGPFGVGEITLRDYEIIICGAALLKPDMGHLDTWPDLFQPEVTYIPHRWDLADLNDKTDALLSDPKKRVETARSAAELYRRALSPDGMIDFAERIRKTTQPRSNEY
jgi:hypothetical protein